MTIVITDRHSATGTPYPNPATMCDGDCEGMGCVPIHRDETDPTYRQLWEAEHAVQHTFRTRLRHLWTFTFIPWNRRLAILWEPCDGWHFVKCPRCHGTRLRPTEEKC